MVKSTSTEVDFMTSRFDKFKDNGQSGPWIAPKPVTEIVDIKIPIGIDHPLYITSCIFIDNNFLGKPLPDDPCDEEVISAIMELEFLGG